MSHDIDVELKLYQDNEGVSICIGVCPDIETVVRIRTTHCDKSKEWYGGFDFSLDMEHAEAFANAVLKQIEFMKNINQSK
ncbi:MAG: hypothetical protein GY750_20805 [Lentisphaerae bacterium]|nr:hypothetical protein [Lentisphaerota bacterium]